MSDQQNDQTETKQEGPSELDMLKSRAKMMGITHSGNIGVDALKAKIDAKMEGQPIPPDATDEVNGLDAIGGATGAPPADESPQQIRERLQRDCMKLVRIRITNLDPKKKDLPGEIISVGNEFLGMVKKFVPFGEVTENGYHVPHIIYEELKSRKFLNIRTSKKAGQIKVDSGWAQEFAIEVLPALTQEELARLAASQAAGNNIGNDIN